MCLQVFFMNNTVLWLHSHFRKQKKKVFNKIFSANGCPYDYLLLIFKKVITTVSFHLKLGLKLLKAIQNMWSYSNHCYAITLKFMKPISLIFPQQCHIKSNLASMFIFKLFKLPGLKQVLHIVFWTHCAKRPITHFYLYKKKKIKHDMSKASFLITSLRKKPSSLIPISLQHFLINMNTYYTDNCIGKTE